MCKSNHIAQTFGAPSSEFRINETEIALTIKETSLLCFSRCLVLKGGSILGMTKVESGLEIKKMLALGKREEDFYQKRSV